MHKTVYLSLGSNVGERAANLKTAIDRLGSLGEVMAVSSFYETEPVEFTAQPWFLNCAVKLNTEKMPRQLLTWSPGHREEDGTAAGTGKRSAHHRHRHSSIREFDR